MLLRLWIKSSRANILPKILLPWALALKFLLIGLGGIGGTPFLTFAQAAPPVQSLTQAGSWVYTSVNYLNETHAVNVYRPSGYPSDAPYPVIYLLHGWGGTPDVWPNEYPILAEQADTYGVLIVAVEGDNSNSPPSWYSPRVQIPWPDGEFWQVSFYDWFFQGVLPWVATNYSIRTDPGGRAIAGFSMGGKGAISLAGHRPDLFAAVAEWGGVMDLRDYPTSFDIQYVYGPVASQALSYAADSPIELAANLKGLSITLLHGADDTFVHYQQSRNMSNKLATLGYTHLWEELPNLAHGVNNYQITRTLQRFDTAFDTPYTPPSVWRYRFANANSRQVYGLTLTKTNPLTWTEVTNITAASFDTLSGDAFTLTTAPLYLSLTEYEVARTLLPGGSSQVSRVKSNAQGRLTLSIPVGSYHFDVALPDLAPPDLSELFYLPIILKK